MAYLDYPLLSGHGVMEETAILIECLARPVKLAFAQKRAELGQTRSITVYILDKPRSFTVHGMIRCEKRPEHWWASGLLDDTTEGCVLLGPTGTHQSFFWYAEDIV
jgi:hypothetical protein